MNKIEYLYKTMFNGNNSFHGFNFKDNCNQIFNQKDNITWSLNKKKRWLDDKFDNNDLVLINRNIYVSGIDFKNKLNTYCVQNNELNKDMIRNKKRSYTGSHCLRQTKLKRGAERSEHKKNKNILKKYINDI